jgi:hypothetical protein
VQPGCINFANVLQRLFKVGTSQQNSADMQAKALADTRQQQQQQQQQQPSLQQALSELRSLTIKDSDISGEDVPKVLMMLATSCKQLRRLVVKGTMFDTSYDDVAGVLATVDAFPALQELSINLGDWDLTMVGNSS